VVHWGDRWQDDDRFEIDDGGDVLKFGNNGELEVNDVMVRARVEDGRGMLEVDGDILQARVEDRGVLEDSRWRRWCPRHKDGGCFWKFC
jgi:hypothetical protein